jgi:hypothetical protein
MLLLGLLLLMNSRVFRRTHLGILMFYLLLFTLLFPTILTCCCIFCCIQVQIFQELSPEYNVVFLSDVAVNLRAFQLFSHGGWLLYLLQKLSPGIVVVVSAFFTCYNISRNSHLGLLLLYLLVLTGVVAYDVVQRFQYFQELSPVDGVVSAVVYRFKYSRNSHLGLLLLYLLFLHVTIFPGTLTWGCYC